MPVFKARFEEPGGSQRPTPQSGNAGTSQQRKVGTHVDTQFLDQRHLESIFSGPPFCSRQEPRLRWRMGQERGECNGAPPSRPGQG